MIPKTHVGTDNNPLLNKYLGKLRKEGFKGDIESDYSSRLLCATDNSVYQCMPLAVIFPRDISDVVTAMKLRAKSPFDSLVITARGGGTGTNGQSLNTGLVMDCSRYLKKISDFDKEHHCVYVESGVIKDELNEYLKKDGLFFSPELSTSNRACIGGMISNDAAGQGSLKYGRTSSHIKEVTVVLVDGTLTTFRPVSGRELQECLEYDGLVGDIYRTCYALLKNCHDKVVKNFPKLNRFMTGYDLYHAYDKETDTLNLARLICGAEGTLGIIVGALLDLTCVPSFRQLMVVKYADFDSALKHAVTLINAGVFSVETVDSKVLNLARHDSVWQGVKDYIEEVPEHEIMGLNIVEFNGNNREQEESKLQNIYDLINEKGKSFADGILGAQIVSTAEGISAVYGMRKKAVGLLGAAAGDKKLVPFTEDTVVPPEHLADYIRDFRALLDSMDVPYGMFGHVDTGLMHVRPALDLTQKSERDKLLYISDEVAKLVASYKGQMWGEHGRGYRAKYGEMFFTGLYEEARKIKAIFDKHNVLNPGKICVPYGNDHDSLVEVNSMMRGNYDELIPYNIRTAFHNSIACNGNGQCFSYKNSDLMCPSYRYTRDHVRSPKGYSELMRDFVRQMTKKGHNLAAEELSLQTHSKNPLSYFKRLYNTLFTRSTDYATEYYKKINTCLACKSCKSICPTHVNAADLNSRFLNLYYGRYLRPLMDILILRSEAILPLMARFPRLCNFLLQNSLAKLFNKLVFGLVDLPPFADASFYALCKKNNFAVLSSRVSLTTDYEVLVVTDPFTVSYEAQGLIEMASVIRMLGFRVAFLKPYENGKVKMIRGDRRGFIYAASKQSSRLANLARKGITLVGYDPALTLCYRDEYRDCLGQMCGEFNVLLPEEWLFRELQMGTGGKIDALKEVLQVEAVKMDEPYYLFTHCTQRALEPVTCNMWQDIFARLGQSIIPVNVACCGMAGLFGHMRKNQEESFAVYKKNWHDLLAARDFSHCLVTGFSCRSQVKRMEHRTAMHPFGIILMLLKEHIKDGQH